MGCYFLLQHMGVGVCLLFYVIFLNLIAYEISYEYSYDHLFCIYLRSNTELIFIILKQNEDKHILLLYCHYSIEYFSIARYVINLNDLLNIHYSKNFIWIVTFNTDNNNPVLDYIILF